MMKLWKRMLGIMICCLVLLLLPLTAAALDDTESNNTTLAAQTFKLGNTINGSISVTDDIDYYKFTITETGRVKLDMTSYMKYYTIHIFDTSGTEIWDTGYNEWNETVGFRNDVHTVDLSAGTYYVKVTGYKSLSATYYNSTGNYTLKTAFTASGATETESNNSVADADTLSRNGTLKGQIALNDRYDFHKVVLSASGRLKLDMTAYMQYYTLDIFDTSGTEIWYTNYNEWNETVGFRNDVYTVDLSAGTYYVKVTGYKSLSATYYNSTGNYTLKTAFTSAKATETEDNNSLANANTLSSGSTVRGQIALNDRYDFYAVTLTKSRTLLIDITSWMQYYTLQVYDINGNELGAVDCKEWNSTAGYREDSYNLALDAGTYYIKVTGYKWKSDTYYKSTGTYKMSINYVGAPVIKATNKASTGKNKITWDAVDGAVSYKVYVSTSKSSGYKLLTTTSNTYMVHTKAVTGKMYYYYVVAYNEYGDKSVKSNIVNRTCDLARPEIKLTNVKSTGKIKVSWKAVEGATKYEVYRATSKDGTYKRITTTKNLYVTNTSAVAGKTYYYKVRAICGVDSAKSAFSTVGYRCCDLARPVVTLSRNSSGNPVIKWDAIKGATKYEVWYATSKNGTYKKLITTKNTKVVNSSAVAGKTYYYKVRAICGVSSATSAYSTVKYIKAK